MQARFARYRSNFSSPSCLSGMACSAIYTPPPDTNINSSDRFSQTECSDSRCKTQKTPAQTFPKRLCKGRNSLRGTTLLPVCDRQALKQRNVPPPFPATHNLYPPESAARIPHIAHIPSGSRPFSRELLWCEIKLRRNLKRLSAGDLFSLSGITGSFAPS